MNVTCEFLGRTANNLFQVAAMIGLCNRTGQQWGVPPNYHHRQIYKYWKFPVYRGNIRKLPVYDVATDEGWSYKEIPDHPNGVKLRGFFQSWRFFEHAKEEVLQAWNFRQYPEYKDYISIHVRRTDYVQHADSFPPIDEIYIHRAFELLHDHDQMDRKVIMFSDDIGWCKNVYGSNKHFEFSEGKNEYEEISKMSSCAVNIIANSTFSWVAAYANPNPEKIVISPHASQWFGPKAKLDTKDLIPLDWNQIKFR